MRTSRQQTGLSTEAVHVLRSRADEMTEMKQRLEEAEAKANAQADETAKMKQQIEQAEAKASTEAAAVSTQAWCAWCAWRACMLLAAR